MQHPTCYLALLFLLITNLSLAQEGIQVTRYDGVGTGELFLELTQDTKDLILLNDSTDVLHYELDQGPINITNVFDGSLAHGTYQLRFLDSDFNANGDPVNWMLEDDEGNQWTSDETINVFNDQIITGRGFFLSIQQVSNPGEDVYNGNGLIGSSLTYENSGTEWLQGVKDDAFPNITNFLRTASNEEEATRDPLEYYANVVDGHWYPYPLLSWRREEIGSGPFDFITPVWTSDRSQTVDGRNIMRDLNNVDIVMTSNKDLWSRCIVVNTYSDYFENQFPLSYDAAPFMVRLDQSVDKDGMPDGTGTGMSWFPGYAIDVETGKRLNIFFGENPFYNDEVTPNSTDLNIATINGKDMIWNPTSELFTPVAPAPFALIEYPLGGQHFIYVTREPYDECANLRVELDEASAIFTNILAWSKISWTTIPTLTSGMSLLPISQGLIPNDVTVKLRVNNSYKKKEATNQNNSLPYYEFTLDSLLVGVTSINEGTTVALLNNPVSLNSGESTYLRHVPENSIISVLSSDGKLLNRWKTGANPDNTVELNPSKVGIRSASHFYIHIYVNEEVSYVKKWAVF